MAICVFLWWWKLNDHFDDVIKGKKAVTLDLCIDVLPHRAAGQEPDLRTTWFSFGWCRRMLWIKMFFPRFRRLFKSPFNSSTALAQSSQKGSPHAGSVICNWSTIARTGSPAHIYDSSQADSGVASIHANTEGQGVGDRETELVTPPSVEDTCASLFQPQLGILNTSWHQIQRHTFNWQSLNTRSPHPGDLGT